MHRPTWHDGAMGLTEFITARLDEDQYLAQGFAFTHQAEWDAEMLGRLWWYGDGNAPKFRSADDPVIRHVARHDAARALREVAAMRVIVAALMPPDEATAAAWSNEEHAAHELYGSLILKPLAAIWSDHADYDPAWALAVTTAH
jgi:hypothetical protein